jgi:hypothetical protein
MSKIIFMDIDGVLNSKKYFTSASFLNEAAGMTTYQIQQYYHHLHLDPEAIKLVNNLIDTSGANVVASTAWRKRYTIDELNFFLEKRGATFTIEDKTPDLMEENPFRYSPRGMEIQQYINFIPIVPESFVILDDCCDMCHLSSRLVQTDENIGITKKDIAKAIKILNKPAIL